MSTRAESMTEGNVDFRSGLLGEGVERDRGGLWYVDTAAQRSSGRGPQQLHQSQREGEKSIGSLVYISADLNSVF